ncbi:hypothetical protein CWI39_0016p0020 [Hamiltosporidium magnivora]|uniref:Uncharacterized protein n=1 Tax=Hamiltosporidium magnivora TaxID=148818 RepID=A0A4Q9LP33_9MICR|nr:hypothetical protein CWI39_0016p0020 [Hamiltosporidium magnivora]
MLEAEMAWIFLGLSVGLSTTPLAPPCYIIRKRSLPTEKGPMGGITRYENEGEDQ